MIAGLPLRHRAALAAVLTVCAFIVGAWLTALLSAGSTVGGCDDALQQLAACGSSPTTGGP